MTSFNPRTHTGCDFAGWSDGNTSATRVSIHAPTRGATGKTCPHTPKSPVSIHAPTRGATGCPSLGINKNVGFNPRTHTGCDRRSTSSKSRSVSFNPRTHTGCDFDFWTKQLCFEFQSTHPHGVRQGKIGIIGAGNYTVSIHAPTRGATAPV